MSLQVSVDFRRIETGLSSVPLKVTRAVRDALETSLRAMAVAHRDRNMSGRPGLIKRTGALQKSFKVTSSVGPGNSLKNLRVNYASDSIYAAIHEFGGVIRPVRARYLAVPLAAALTAVRGVPRWRSPLRVSLRSAFAATFVQRSRAGNLILFGVPRGRNKAKKIIPLFALRKSVRIPPRLGLRRIWREWRSRIGVSIRAALKAASVGQRIATTGAFGSVGGGQ